MALVLVCGAKGQVGSEVHEILLQRGHKVIAAGHDTLDISEENEVNAIFSSTRIDAVINCAAYTKVDLAEDEESKAYAINALGPKYLARACKEADIPLVHISTDYVYDNNESGPHVESENLNTRCVYGKTKLFGEKFITENCDKYVILRASWIFGPKGNNFVKAMLRLGKDRDELKVVSDEEGNPTPARPLAEACVTLAERMLDKDFRHYGIYNYCGVHSINRCDFARVILTHARELNLLDHEVTVSAILSRDFGAKARRPADSRMSTEKFTTTFNMAVPDWQEYLDDTLTQA